MFGSVTGKSLNRGKMDGSGDRPLHHAWLLAATLALVAGGVHARTCTSAASGNWSASSTWTGCKNGIPRSNGKDNVVISGGNTVTIDTNANANSLTIESAATLVIGNNGTPRTLTVDRGMTVSGTFAVGGNAAGTPGHALLVNGALNINAGGVMSQDDLPGNHCDVTVSGAFTNQGSYTVGPSGPDFTVNGTATNSGTFRGTSIYSQITFNGNLSNTGTFDTSNATTTFSGTGTQTLSGAGSTIFGNLKLDNGSGLTLSGNNPIIAGTLALNSGIITTGASILTVAPNCATSPVSRSSGYVNGYLRLTFPSGTPTCTFDIGSSTAYAPLSLAVAASGSGTLTASTTGAEHPQIASSPIDSTRDANRYWTLGTGGDTLASVVSSYGATFNFAPADLDSGASTGNFGAAAYAGGSWTSLGPVTAGSTSTGVSGVAGPIVAPTDFAVGESASACSIPSGLPSNMTCVCDHFGRSDLNPSTIYGGNWGLSTSGGSFGVPKIVNPGYLRMTDSSTGVATAATMPGTFPAAGNLIQIEFKHYAYNGSGADGVALTLSDASITPSPGAFGGSLGYAQKSNPGSDCTVSGGCPGFAGGWIGIALDEYGGFSANTEGRTGGPAPGQTPDAVAVRGSGSGQTGYPYLAGSGSLNPGIDNPSSGSPANGYLYRIKVDARNYTSSNKTTIVSVDRDTSGTGNSYTSVVAPFDAFAVNASQAAVPTDWKLSLTGSTGGLTNIHEIGAVKICAQTITPPAGYDIQVDNRAPSTCGTPGGTPSSPTVTVTALDTNGNTVTTYNKTVTLSATLSGGGAAHASWSLKSGSGTLSGNQYTFASADQGSAQFYLSDTSSEDVYITVSENGGTMSSSTPTSQAVQFSGGTFIVAVPNTEPAGEAVVAGRPHQLTVTRTICSGGTSTTDTSYSGTRQMDGWYVPDQYHPAGAAAPQLCARNAANTCLSTAGTCQTLALTSSNVPLAFTNGVANVCLGTSDVGKYAIFLRDGANAGAPVTGSSDVLTVRPFAVAVSGVSSASGANNPATGSPAPDAGTPVFATAGANFSATVAGYLWSSSGDANLDGFPDSGANWSQITSGGIASHYADTVNLSAGAPFAPATPVDSPAGSGVAGTLGGGSVAVSNGSATQLSLSYSEVGSFSLHAQPSTAYLHSSGTYVADLSNRVAIFANPSLSTQSAWVGRFKPDHFAFSGTPAIVPRSDINSGSGCSPTASTFTYMGEPMRVGFSLQAVALGGSVTQNYAGSYAHFSPASSTDWLTRGAANGMGLWMIANNYVVGGGTCKAVFSTGTTTDFQSCTGATPSPVTRALGQRVALSGTPASSGWSGGLASFSADVVLERADTADGPYGSLQLGIAPQDTDGVAFSSYNLDADNNNVPERQSLGTTATRYGRLLIPSMYGSELLPMPIKLQAQYWNGSAYVSNADDSCTSIAGSNFSLSSPTGGTITSGMVSVQGSGTLDAGGAGTISLSRPTPAPAGKGYVSLSPTSTLGKYLPGSGIETFGVYRGGRVIYLREGYY